MVFSFISKAVGNTLDVATDLVFEQKIETKKVKRLLNDGLTVYEIAEVTGIGVNTVRKLLED